MTENDNKVNILMRSPVFRDLPKEALNAITLAVRDRVAPQHTIIHRQGDPGDSLYIISSGRVRIFGRNEKGVEIDLSIQGPGDTFGEMALLTGESMSADVEVLEEAHLMILSKDQFDRILRDFPDISKVFVKEMRRWLLRDDERLEMEARKAYKASRMSWVDFFLVILISIVLAVVFNTTNPNGISLFPEFPDRSSIPTVSPSAAMEEIQHGETLILDAMPANFYQQRHIGGAVNIPLGLFDIVYLIAFAEEDKEKQIVVYGETISKPYDLEVADKLLLRGYRNVRILDGGLTAWENRGYPVEERAKK
ncbi:MAG: cyclic nucleotide-binding domain-containing protein [Syntrophobacteraceae bacterium]|jgi:rhodanese-related sulfurtransferase